MSDTYSSGRPPVEAKDDANRLKDAATREAASARDEAARAGSTLKDEASRLAAGAKEKAYESVEEGKSIATGSLNDFTAAIRKASDELGERDQSMAANLVREAASGLESVSNAIEGKSIQEIASSVAGFARRQPTAFFIGAALAGIALGRFARASGEHESHDYAASNGSSYGNGSRNRGGVNSGQGSSYGTSSSGDYGSSSSATSSPASRTTAAATASGVTTTPGSTSTPATSAAFATPSSHSTAGTSATIGGGNER